MYNFDLEKFFKRMTFKRIHSKITRFNLTPIELQAIWLHRFESKLTPKWLQGLEWFLTPSWSQSRIFSKIFIPVPWSQPDSNWSYLKMTPSSRSQNDSKVDSKAWSGFWLQALESGVTLWDCAEKFRNNSGLTPAWSHLGVTLDSKAWSQKPLQALESLWSQLWLQSIESYRLQSNRSQIGVKLNLVTSECK